MYMKKSKYTVEVLTPVVKKSKSYSQVVRGLGLKVSGGSSAYIKDKIVLLGIDTAHFTGQLWSKGTTKETNDIVKAQAEKMTLSPKEVLRDGVMFKGAVLRRVLIEAGVPYLCKECGLGPVWNGRGLTLHVDHISGNRRDCRKNNLRFLCPNCHQQTPTWGKGEL